MNEQKGFSTGSSTTTNQISDTEIQTDVTKVQNSHFVNNECNFSDIEAKELSSGHQISKIDEGIENIPDSPINVWQWLTQQQITESSSSLENVISSQLTHKGSDDRLNCRLSPESNSSIYYDAIGSPRKTSPTHFPILLNNTENSSSQWSPTNRSREQLFKIKEEKSSVYESANCEKSSSSIFLSDYLLDSANNQTEVRHSQNSQHSNDRHPLQTNNGSSWKLNNNEQIFDKNTDYGWPNEAHLAPTNLKPSKTAIDSGIHFREVADGAVNIALHKQSVKDAKSSDGECDLSEVSFGRKELNCPDHVKMKGPEAKIREKINQNSDKNFHLLSSQLRTHGGSGSRRAKHRKPGSPMVSKTDDQNNHRKIY